MAIKINGTTVIDNSRNLTSIEAATFTGTGYVKVPSGTDAQRPGSPVAGMFRYNTTSNTFEGYVSGAWVENLHTGNIAPTHIPEDTTHRWTTDAEKTVWNAAYTHSQAAHAPSNAQKNSDITKAEIEAKLTGVISTHSHTDEVPAGVVIFTAMSTPPTGYLKANGAAISRTTYAALFAKIGTTYGAGNGTTTFNVPDLRGEFVRGFDDARGVDSGRVFGSAQGSANLSHTHSTDSQGAHTHTVPGLPTGSGETGWGSNEYGFSFGNIATSSAGAHTHTALASGGTEARPRNIAMLACIKF